MNIENQIVFVTGAARGLGLEFAREAVARGAKKVYAGVRDVEAFSQEGIIPIHLDVTKPETIQKAVAACADTTVLVNNAGIARLNNNSLDDDFIQMTLQMMDTNFYGLVRTSQAFAPVLAANGGGAILNVLSNATWVAPVLLAAYSATKSAAWSFTNSLRTTLKGNKTRVLGLHVGFLDTDMTHGFDMPKTQPRVVAQATYDGLADGVDEVLADEGTRAIKADLSNEISIYLDFNPEI